MESLESVSGFSLYEDPNLTDEGKRLIAEGKTLRYEANFDFEKIHELNLYPHIPPGGDLLAECDDNPAEEFCGFHPGIPRPDPGHQ